MILDLLGNTQSNWCWNNRPCQFRGIGGINQVAAMKTATAVSCCSCFGMACVCWRLAADLISSRCRRAGFTCRPIEEKTFDHAPTVHRWIAGHQGMFADRKKMNPEIDAFFISERQPLSRKTAWLFIPVCPASHAAPRLRVCSGWSRSHTVCCCGLRCIAIYRIPNLLDCSRKAS